MNEAENLPSQALIKEALLAILKESAEGLHINDIESAVAKRLLLTQSQVALIHAGKRTMLGYKLAWARTSAKKEGLVISPRYSVWKIVN